MPAPRISELPRLLRRGILRRAHLQDPRRDPADHGKVGNIPDHHRIRANDDVITHTYPPKNFRSGTELDTTADSGRTQRIVEAGVTEGHAVTDQAVIADYGRAVYDDAAMVLDGQPPTDGRRCADTDSTENLDQLVEYDVSDRPGRAHEFVADHEAGVSETVHQQSPETDSQQSFPLRFEVFQQVYHEQGADCDGQSAAAESYAIVVGTATDCRRVDNKVKRAATGQLSVVQG
jgi:hypothetical protein